MLLVDIDFRKRKDSIMRDAHDISNRYERGCQEAKRVHDIVVNTEAVLEDLDRQFCEKTG